MNEFMSGAIAGTFTMIPLYPLDSLKTRMQSVNGLKNSGGFYNIQRGILATSFSAPLSAGIFFSSYTKSQNFLKGNGCNIYTAQFISAAVAEFLSTCIHIPTDMVSQRMQVGMYTTYSGAIKSIYNTGLASFYGSIYSTFAREIIFSIIQLPMYELLKKNVSEDCTAIEGAACGSLSAGITAAITTPLDVVRTRIIVGAPDKQNKPYNSLSIYKTASRIVYQEGILALFKGIIPRTIWISLHGCFLFGTYEYYLKKLNKT